jgi:hypothetical protein
MSAFLLAAIAVAGFWLYEQGAIPGITQALQSLSASTNLAQALTVFSTPVSVSGVGTGTKVAIGSAAQGSVNATDATAKEIGTVASTGLGVAAVGGIVALFTSIFKGANPLQVDAAQIEQIYEATALNLMAVCQKLEMITSVECVDALNALITAGQQAETEYSGQIGTPASKGSANLTSVIQGDITTIQSSAQVTVPVSINISKAQAVYVGTGSGLYGSSGWYADAISAAATLSTAFLQSL